MGTVITLFEDSLFECYKYLSIEDISIEHLKIDREDYEKAELVRFVSDNIKVHKILKDRYGYKGIIKW